VLRQQFVFKHTYILMFFTQFNLNNDKRSSHMCFKLVYLYIELSPPYTVTVIYKYMYLKYTPNNGIIVLRQQLVFINTQECTYILMFFTQFNLNNDKRSSHMFFKLIYLIVFSICCYSNL
jgi:hypothetical protein